MKITHNELKFLVSKVIQEQHLYDNNRKKQIYIQENIFKNIMNKFSKKGGEKSKENPKEKSEFDGMDIPQIMKEVMFAKDYKTIEKIYFYLHDKYANTPELKDALNEWAKNAMSTNRINFDTLPSQYADNLLNLIFEKSQITNPNEIFYFLRNALVRFRKNGSFHISNYVINKFLTIADNSLNANDVYQFFVDLVYTPGSINFDAIMRDQNGKNLIKNAIKMSNKHKYTPNDFANAFQMRYGSKSDIAKISPSIKEILMLIEPDKYNF